MARILLDDPSHAGGSDQLLIGTVYDDNTGDKLRDGGVKLKQWAADLNTMLAELYGVGAFARIAYTYGAGAQDNVTPTGFVANSTNRIEATANSADSTVNWLPACSDGFKMRLYNVGSTGRIILGHEAGSSAASGRLHLPGLAAFYLPPGFGCVLEYIGALTRWMVY